SPTRQRGSARASTLSTWASFRLKGSSPCYRAPGNEQRQGDGNLDAIIANAQRDPGQGRAGKGQGKEQRRVDGRADHAGKQRRLPPGALAQPVEDGYVHQLRNQKGRARGQGDARA